MKKNIKLIPLFLFLFVFQLLYFLSTIYTEKIDHMFLILAVFMVLICILLYCVLSDVLKKSNTEMELTFLQKQSSDPQTGYSGFSGQNCTGTSGLPTTPGTGRI